MDAFVEDGVILHKHKPSAPVCNSECYVVKSVDLPAHVSLARDLATL